MNHARQFYQKVHRMSVTYDVTRGGRADASVDLEDSIVVV